MNTNTFFSMENGHFLLSGVDLYLGMHMDEFMGRMEGYIGESTGYNRFALDDVIFCGIEAIEGECCFGCKKDDKECLSEIFLKYSLIDDFKTLTETMESSIPKEYATKVFYIYSSEMYDCELEIIDEDIEIHFTLNIRNFKYNKRS